MLTTSLFQSRVPFMEARTRPLIRTRHRCRSPVTQQAELLVRQTPDATPGLAGFVLRLLEAVQVARSWREGGDLRVAFSQQRLVEHCAVGEGGVGEEPPVVVLPLGVELQGDVCALRAVPGKTCGLFAVGLRPPLGVGLRGIHPDQAYPVLTVDLRGRAAKSSRREGRRATQGPDKPARPRGGHPRYAHHKPWRRSMNETTT